MALVHGDFDDPFRGCTRRVFPDRTDHAPDRRSAQRQHFWVPAELGKPAASRLGRVQGLECLHNLAFLCQQIAPDQTLAENH